MYTELFQASIHYLKHKYQSKPEILASSAKLFSWFLRYKWPSDIPIFNTTCALLRILQIMEEFYSLILSVGSILPITNMALTCRRLSLTYSFLPPRTFQKFSFSWPSNTMTGSLWYKIVIVKWYCTTAHASTWYNRLHAIEVSTQVCNILIICYHYLFLIYLGDLLVTFLAISLSSPVLPYNTKERPIYQCKRTKQFYIHMFKYILPIKFAKYNPTHQTVS